MIKMRKSLTGQIAAALLLTGVAFAAPPALAGTPEPVADAASGAIEQPVSPAELRDLETLAAQNGISTKEAIERYGWGDNFAVVADVIRRTWPSDFAGAAIVDGRNAWIAYKGTAPEGVGELLGRLAAVAPNVSVVTRPNTGFTELELQDAIERVHFTALSLAGVENAATTFDYDTSEMTVRLVGARLDIEDLSRTLTERLGSLAKVMRVTIVESDRIGGRDSSTYHHGGEALSGCTSGFGTINSSGVRGVATAGHCSDAQSDDGSALTFRGQHQGVNGDFQWHTGPKIATDDFYAGSSAATEVDLRDVSSIGAPVVGQSLCKNGATAYKSCQEVRLLNVCSGSVCNLVQMGARLAAPGDSGGPIYWGETAYGLHQGWMYDPAWPFDRDLFSRADRILTAIGVSIATN